jgi:ABC-2 type transport system permease protein
VVGIVSFCCVGFLMTLPVRSEQSAPALTQALVLPLQFMSGVFFPRGTVPEWMLDVAALFPIKHLVDAMFVVFDPRHTGSRFAGGNLLVLAAWGLVSLVLAARYFRWTPTNR